MISNGSADTGEHERSPWTQPGFIASAIVVGLIVVLALILAVTSGSKGEAKGGTAAPPPVASSGPTQATGRGACDLPTNDVVPESAPQAAWELVGTMAAPTAPAEIGPAKMVAGFRRCFAHSPVGALYAAVNFWATLSDKPSAATYHRLAAPSPAQRAAIKAAAGQGEDRLRSGLQIAGYAFNSYQRDRAGIKLAFRLDDGRFFAVDNTMLWNADRDDWFYEVPLDQARGSITPVADLSTVVAWKGT
jgi:hypothetical protein